MDGTLVDSDSFVRDGFRFALADTGISVTAALIELLRGRRVGELFSGLLSQGEAKVATERLQRFDREHAKHLRRSEELCAFLTEGTHRTKAAIWTGRSRESTLRILASIGLASAFDLLISSDDLIEQKPACEGLMRICNNLEINPSELVAVGDHVHDMEAANGCGAISALAQWYHDAPVGCSPQFRFHDPVRFIDWLKGSI